MAWIRERETRRGVVYSVEWRDPVTREPGHERVGYDRGLAEARKHVVEAQVEGVRSDVVRAASAKALLDAFLDHKRADGARQGTLDFYRKHLGRFVAEWGAVTPDRWTPRMLTALLASREWSPRTAQMVVRAGRAWAKWAKSAGLLLPDFTAGVRAPRVVGRRVEAMPPDRVHALLAASVGHRLELAVHLAACAGLGRGDVLTLDWRDVHLAEGWIRASRAKTGEEIRVPIVEPLTSALKRHQALGGPVCRTLPARTADFHAMLRRLCRRAGVKPGGLHQLRHAWATMMLAAGVDVATIARLLAHRQGSAMVMRYLHPTDAQLVSALATVQRALAP